VSYSFSAKGKTKAEALAAAEAAMKKVIEGQPIHAQDEAAARKCREEAAALVGEPPADKDYFLSCSGSFSWIGVYPDSHIITGASINVFAGHTARE
jgi:hypothetical protein